MDTLQNCPRCGTVLLLLLLLFLLLVETKLLSPEAVVLEGREAQVAVKGRASLLNDSDRSK